VILGPRISILSQVKLVNFKNYHIFKTTQNLKITLRLTSRLHGWPSITKYQLKMAAATILNLV